MSVTPTYPGVYIQELSSGVRTITGVATSVTAFVGRTKRGVVDEPVICHNPGEFTRHFGGLWSDGPLSYAVEDFFTNGGSQAMIVRLFKQSGGNGVAELILGNLKLQAASAGPQGAEFSPGAWGNKLKGTITHPADEDEASAAAKAAEYGLGKDDLFDLTIVDEGADRRETFRNLTVDVNGGALRIDRVLREASSLVRVKETAGGQPELPATRPAKVSDVAATGGDDGGNLTASNDFIGDETEKTGLHALLKADLFNLLCIPPDTRNATLGKQVREKAAEFCAKHRALYIVDPPHDWDANPAVAASKVKAAQLDPTNAVLPLTYASNAALFFPRIRKRDRLRGMQMDTFVPCGAVAGVMARTDVNRGVWKAPAGTAATLSGVDELSVRLNDDENGLLNPIAVNCLRSFPVVGRVIWGSRTLKGSDQLSDDYKYVPVRRLALFIEESLYRGTQWVVFEPNDEPLWAQIRLTVGAFMQRLFSQGAFQGSNPRDAYFVKCDSETTTQDDINRGIVNIEVGFAPPQPAEFVIISIQQIRSA